MNYDKIRITLIDSSGSLMETVLEGKLISLEQKEETEAKYDPGSAFPREVRATGFVELAVCLFSEDQQRVL